MTIVPILSEGRRDVSVLRGTGTSTCATGDFPGGAPWYGDVALLVKMQKGTEQLGTPLLEVLLAGHSHVQG